MPININAIEKELDHFLDTASDEEFMATLEDAGLGRESEPCDGSCQGMCSEHDIEIQIFRNNGVFEPAEMFQICEALDKKGFRVFRSTEGENNIYSVDNKPQFYDSLDEAFAAIKSKNYQYEN